jgi:hypothetical protein
MQSLHAHALAGSSNAQTKLGLLLKWSGEVDNGQEWLEKAVEQGDHVALSFIRHLSQAFVLRVGPVFLEKMRCEMNQVLRERGHKGDMLAQYAMAKVSTSSEEELKWGLMAAEQGLARAQYFVAQRYEDMADEHNIERHRKEAVKWNAKAAEQGEPLAMLDLGYSYKEKDDRGAPIDEEKAFMWTSKAIHFMNVYNQKVGKSKCPPPKVLQWSESKAERQWFNDMTVKYGAPHYDELDEMVFHYGLLPSEDHNMQREVEMQNDDFFLQEIHPVSGIPGLWVIVQAKCGKLTDDGLTFEKLSRGAWMCATRGSQGWSAGVHTWSVRLDRSAAHISVGISERNINFEDASENCDLRYDVYGGSGSAFSPDTEDIPCFGKALCDGDEVMIRLDLEDASVTFGLNNMWNPAPTFANIPHGEYFPYFALEKKGAKFSIKK